MWKAIAVLAIALGCAAGLPHTAAAHCDGMDGPVVTAARAALDSGRVESALIWVEPGDEAEVRRAFERARAVRGLGPEAKELADLHFFETVVRLHRAAEGAPFAGLAPAGRDLGPAIPGADRALENGSLEALERLLVQSVERGLRGRFEAARARKDFRAGDVGAGRAWVAAYVPFVHYVERIHTAATAPAEGHYPEAQHGHEGR
jgi:hypothetical protein